MTTDPFAQFDEWFAAAHESEANDPEAMALATCDADGQPSVRMVLLKGHGPDGFIFYTNTESRKGQALAANPHAALLFHWKSLRRQVRIEGPVVPVSAAQADAYFASRPRDSQIGAWASDQSRPLAGRAELLGRIAQAGARYAIGKVPRPTYWSGYRLSPRRVEFWEDQPFRIHHRELFTRDDGGEWTSHLLFP